MATDAQASYSRSRFLVVHDDCVALDARGPFRDLCVALTDRGADVHVVAAEDAAAATNLTQDATNCGGYDVVLVAGRADVLAGVKTGLADSGLPLGILPFGDGVTISRSLGMLGKPRQVAALLCTAPVAKFPGLLANGLPVNVMASVGMDKDTLGTFSRYVCSTLPRGSMSSSFASNLLRKVERFDAVVDGANYRCCAAFVLRAGGYGRSLPCDAAGAEMGDALRVVLIEADDRVGLFDLSVGAKIGRFFKDKSVNARTCTHFDVPAGQSLVVEADGRTLADGTSVLNALQMSADPAALSVITAIEVMDQLGMANGDMIAA